MVLCQRRPVAHADHGDPTLHQDGVQELLGGHVQGARRFIQHGPARSIQEQSREGQALLLSEAQQTWPVLARDKGKGFQRLSKAFKGLLNAEIWISLHEPRSRQSKAV